jgi:hypothetical protein
MGRRTVEGTDGRLLDPASDERFHPAAPQFRVTLSDLFV